MRRFTIALAVALVACSDSPVEPKLEAQTVRASMTVGCKELFCTLDASPSVGNIAHYRIDYGDGSITWTDTPVAVHHYAKRGNYQLGLVVISPDGNVSEWSGRLSL